MTLDLRVECRAYFKKKKEKSATLRDVEVNPKISAKRGGSLLSLKRRVC